MDAPRPPAAPAPLTGQTAAGRRVWSAALRWALPLLIAAIALAVLHRLSNEITLVEVRADAADYSAGILALALAATLLGYLALSIYDVVILRGLTAARPPAGVLMLTGACSMAVSNMLGFAWLTGGAVRYRVYAAYGVDLAAVARLMATTWVAFLIGLIALAGALMIAPSGGGPGSGSGMTELPAGIEALLGLALLTALGAFFLWTRGQRRGIGIGAFRLDLPQAGDGFRIALASAIDIASTALVLYVLLPPDLAQDFGLFLAVFVVAISLGFLSHAPGGIGVFEATMIAGLGAAGRADVLAALVVYRVIYTVVPFVIAAAGLALAWTIGNRHRVRLLGRGLWRGAEPVVPGAVAAVVMLAGGVLLLTGTVPPDAARLGFMRALAPPALVEASPLIGSIIGALLLVIARGLWRRAFRAWLVATALVGLGVFLSLTQGTGVHHAAALAATGAILWNCRAAFYRGDVGARFTLDRTGALSLALLMAAIGWIGIVTRIDPILLDSLWWQVAAPGDASGSATATLALAVLLAAALLNTLFSRAVARLPPEPVPDIVRKLTAASPCARAGIALSGDKRFLVSDDGRAYIAYADTGTTLVSKGDPVGAPDAGIETIWKLRELADTLGRKTAFWGITDRYLPTCLDLGMTLVKTGETARVDLASFSLDGPRRKDWRYARARVARDGYLFEVIPAERVAGEIAGLRAVSDAWLTHKNGTEKGFSLGWFCPEYLINFDFAVLREARTGRITAFANLMQGGDRSDISIDLMRYDPAGPSVAMDALFAEMLLWAKAAGFATFSLGAAPLSGLECRRLAPAWHRIGGLIYTHGAPLYHFAGLRAFKQKFDPDWAPEYLATSGRFGAAQVLLEVGLLVSRGPHPDRRLERDAAPPRAVRGWRAQLMGMFGMPAAVGSDAD